MDRSALLEDIASAFARTRRDPDQSLHQAQLCDRGMSNPASGAEWRAAGERDPETNWSEIPGVAIDECDAALSFFTPESWRFYLPAYLCRSLFHFSAPRFEVGMLGSVLFQLTLLESTDQYKLERYNLLSEGQRQAVLHFLQIIEREALLLVEATNRYWSTYDDAKNALHSHWHAEARET